MARRSKAARVQSSTSNSRSATLIPPRWLHAAVPALDRIEIAKPAERGVALGSSYGRCFWVAWEWQYGIGGPPGLRGSPPLEGCALSLGNRALKAIPPQSVLPPNPKRLRRRICRSQNHPGFVSPLTWCVHHSRDRVGRPQKPIIWCHQEGA